LPFCDVGGYVCKKNLEDRIEIEFVLVQVQKNRVNGDEMAKTIVVFKLDHGLCYRYTFAHLIEMSGNKFPYYVEDEGMSLWKKVQVFLTSPRTTVNLSERLIVTHKLPWNLGLNNSSSLLLSKINLKSFTCRHLLFKTW